MSNLSALCLFISLSTFIISFDLNELELFSFIEEKTTYKWNFHQENDSDTFKTSLPVFTSKIYDFPLYYKRENGSHHINISYLTSDTLITTNTYLHCEVYVNNGSGIYKSDTRKLRFTHGVGGSKLNYYDQKINKEYTYEKVEEEYSEHMIPNIFVIHRDNGERQGVIIFDHFYYDPFILRDTSKYILSELALQLTHSNLRSFRDDEARYSFSNDGSNLLFLGGCFLCSTKASTIDLNKMTLKNSPTEKVETYRFNFEKPQIKGCMFGDCIDGYGVQRVVIESKKCVIIEGNFINGKLEGEGMVSTVINIGRGFFSSKLIVEHKNGIPNGEGVEYLCGLKHEKAGGHPLYRKGIWKDGQFKEGIDNSDPNDVAYHYKTLGDYMKEFLEESNTNNTHSNSDFTILEGSSYLTVSKYSTESIRYVHIDVSDEGLFSSNVCKDSYIVSYKDRKGNVSNTFDPTKDSSDDVGCEEFNYPIECEIRYKNQCSSSNVKTMIVKFYKPGIYNIRLEKW